MTSSTLHCSEGSGVSPRASDRASPSTALKRRKTIGKGIGCFDCLQSPIFPRYRRDGMLTSIRRPCFIWRAQHSLRRARAVHLRSLRQEKGDSSRFPNFPLPHAVYCSNACSATQVMHNMGRVQFYRGVCQGGREAGKIFFCSKPLWLCTLRSVDLRDTSGLSHGRWPSFGVNTDTITTPSVGGQKQQQNNSQHQLVTRWV